MTAGSTRAATAPAHSCPRCRIELVPGGLDGLCPACLMTMASASVSAITDERPTEVRPLAESAARCQPPRLSPGERFGSYHIKHLLGRGGMGEVYDAEQVESGRRVALKVLDQRLEKPAERARFLREGQLAGSINHSNTVYIFGTEEIAGTPVIAMEILSGGTLQDRVRAHGPLPPADAVGAILQVLEGLEAAHAAGILHRDIKPSNCFMDADGSVKVGDFGLSIPTTAGDVWQPLATGTFQGTPSFAAPEQLRGDPLDVRADIYAVGATLYYLLTGQPPFDDRDLVSLVRRITAEAPRSPHLLRPCVPKALARIVLRCLSTDRAARPATCASMARDLRAFGGSIQRPPTIGLGILTGTVDGILPDVDGHIQSLVDLLFSTARRWNGFAGLHETVGTCVVPSHVRPAVTIESHASRQARSAPAGPLSRLGPFEITETLRTTTHGHLLLAVDPLLQRKVWIHRQSHEAPAASVLRRDLNRPGRLRWLAGGRTGRTVWDAYEAPAGMPLALVIAKPQPWRSVRQWLLDLARELDAGLADGTLPALQPDRIWIGTNGRARILDFEAPEVPPPSGMESGIAPVTCLEAQRFLHQLGRDALRGTGTEGAARRATGPQRSLCYPHRSAAAG